MHTPKQNWLVTGGAGFIGSHIVKQLLAQGQQVTVVDDFSSGTLNNLPAGAPNLQILKGTILDLAFLKNAAQKMDFILHHAALVSVPLSIEHPNETYTINVQGTANVLEAAKTAGVKRVVFASTCAVYGAGSGQPLAENAPLNPTTPYALSKAQGEELCRSYRQLYGLDSVILRYFNVYGPGQTPGGPYSAVIAKFLDCALKHQPFPIESDGQQTRDFIFVQDVARANLWAALQAQTGEVYNVGSGVSQSLLSLAKLIEQVCGYPIKTHFFPQRAGDIRRSQADVSKLRQAGFNTQTPLLTGLQNCWQHLQNKDDYER